MFCSPLWLRKGSEKFLKCVWWGRRDVTRINSKLEKAGKTSQLQRETEPSALQRFGASFPVPTLLPEAQHGEKGGGKGLGVCEAAERLRKQQK